MIDAQKLGIRHIGIIMDGNGRWAKKRLMPRKVGHRAGAKTFRTISEHCRLMGLQCLTVYAFSTENWARPADEVSAIMNLLRDYLNEVFEDRDSYLKKNMKIRFIGDITQLDGDLQDKIAEIEETSREMSGMILNVAVNYGGRSDILRAARLLADSYKKGEISLSQIDENAISLGLYTAGEPDPDLILRTGGEYRLSNFLIWQAAYAEYMATPTLWPDFKPVELEHMLEKFSKRERRFGSITE